jgi:hypothetical protein
VDRQTRRLEQAVARAAVRREIRRVDSAATAVAIFDLTRGLVARRMLSTGNFDLGEDVAFLSELVWRGLRKGSGLRDKEKGISQKAKGSKRHKG